MVSEVVMNEWFSLYIKAYLRQINDIYCTYKLTYVKFNMWRLSRLVISVVWKLPAWTLSSVASLLLSIWLRWIIPPDWLESRSWLIPWVPYCKMATLWWGASQFKSIRRSFCVFFKFCLLVGCLFCVTPLRVTSDNEITQWLSWRIYERNHDL